MRTEQTGERHTDSRGRVIEQCIDRQQLNMLNNGASTHISGTAIDVTITSPEVTPDCDWQVYESVLNSDHFAIILTIAKPPSQTEPGGNFNYKKANWQEYSLDKVWKELPGEEQGITVDTLVEDFYNRLDTAAENHIPRYILRRHYPKYWWSGECTRVWKERERCYRRWKTTGELRDKVKWKLVRAVATRTFKLAKQNEFREYISGMKINTPAQKIYEKLRKIRITEARKVNILRKNGQVYTTTQEIVDYLAESFHQVSKSSNCNSQFLTTKRREEGHRICFQSDICEAYNKEFTVTELNWALQKTNNTPPIPDRIHYNMLKYLPKSAQQHLLDLYNRMSTETYVPQNWKEATIIPIPKPNKDQSDPANYRPIALTSCACKVFKKMINSRLQQ